MMYIVLLRLKLTLLRSDIGRARRIGGTKFVDVKKKKNVKRVASFEVSTLVASPLVTREI